MVFRYKMAKWQCFWEAHMASQTASYLAQHSFLFRTDGTVNYDYIITNSINCLLIGSRCIPNGAHTNHCWANLAHASKPIKHSAEWWAINILSKLSFRKALKTMSHIHIMELVIFLNHFGRMANNKTIHLSFILIPYFFSSYVALYVSFSFFFFFLHYFLTYLSHYLLHLKSFHQKMKPPLSV